MRKKDENKRHKTLIIHASKNKHTNKSKQINKQNTLEEIKVLPSFIIYCLFSVLGTVMNTST